MVRPIPVQLRQEQLQRPLTLFFDDTYTRAIRSDDSNVDFSSHDNNKPVTLASNSSSSPETMGEASGFFLTGGVRRKSSVLSLHEGTSESIKLSKKKTKKGFFSSLLSGSKSKIQTVTEESEQNTV